MRSARVQKLEPGAMSLGARRILHAAEKLFAERGFSAASMSAIAKKAGVSKANIYHHFPTKDDLYRAVIRLASEAVREMIADIESDHEPLTTRLPRFAEAHLNGFLEHSDLARLVLTEILMDTPRRSRELAEGGFARNFGLLTRVIRSAQKTGELRKDADPAAVAVMVIAANLFFFLNRDVLRHYKEFGYADDPARYAKTVAKILLDGVKAPEKKVRRKA